MKLNTKIVLLLVATLPLLIVWSLVSGIETKYDWFLLIDFYQQPKWYVHYSAGFFSTVVLTYIVHDLSRRFLSKTTQHITLILLLFSIFRLISYWLIRFNMPMLPFILSLVLFSLTYHFFKNDGKGNPYA